MAAGCRKLGLTSRPTGIPQAQAVAAAGQSALILTYEEAFAEFGLKVAQILLTHDDLESRHRFLNARNTLLTLLGWQVVPIINENDTVATDELKFGDNDNLAALICNLVGADLLVILTDIDGLYDKDPREHPDARLVAPGPHHRRQGGEGRGQTARRPGPGRHGDQAPGRQKGRGRGHPHPHRQRPDPGHPGKNLCRRSQVGTLFLPQDQKLTSRQYWLAYNVTPKGAILVDHGARAALVQRHKSLLPAGILEVFGGFVRATRSTFMDSEGKPFAVGLTNYSAREIGRIKGRQSQEIAQSLGHKGYDEVIHRDNLVIFPEI